MTKAVRQWLAEFSIDAPDLEISELVIDSREVAIHSAFLAIKGHQRDGRDFIPQAISLGAKLILVECEQADTHGQLQMREQSVLVSFYQLHAHLSELAVAFYGQPAEQLKVVAVTGTNGKTSTAQLSGQLASLMEQPSAVVGTLGVQHYQQGHCHQFASTLNTTPDAVRMQHLLAQLARQHIQHVALEASSHALVQQRIAALKTDVAIFTNLTRDHLDYHGTMSAYARAKRQLLQQPGLRFAVINADDAEANNWLAALPANVTPVLFSSKHKPGNVSERSLYCYASHLQFNRQGCALQLNSSWGNGYLQLGLLGEFNVANLLAALAAHLCLGADFAALLSAAAQVKPIAGRMERYAGTGQATILVDYAHTPDALSQVLQAARKHCSGKLWCIFGCGGERDQGKRPLMGEVAEQQADQVILTNDNTRSEAAEAIMQDILAGCVNPEKIKIEPQRQAAIRLALAEAAEQDVIVVAGKGHETTQHLGEQIMNYDERAFVAQLVNERKL